MRCKKCGWISFDYLDTCGRCGKSMEDEKRLLGMFVADIESVNWFKLGNEIEDIKEEQVPETESPTEVPEIPMEEPVEIEEPIEFAESQIEPSEQLADIDVSDLVDEGPIQDTEEIAFEEVELKRIAQDQDFQKALDEISGQLGH